MRIDVLDIRTNKEANDFGKKRCAGTTHQQGQNARQKRSKEKMEIGQRPLGLHGFLTDLGGRTRKVLENTLESHGKSRKERSRLIGKRLQTHKTARIKTSGFLDKVFGRSFFPALP